MLQRLPGGNVRAVAQVFECGLSVVRAFVVREVVQSGVVLVVATRAEWCTERVCIVREHAAYMPYERFVRDENEFDVYARWLALGFELTIGVQPAHVGEDVRESTLEDRVVLSLARLLIEKPVDDI